MRQRGLSSIAALVVASGLLAACGRTAPTVADDEPDAGISAGSRDLVARNDPQPPDPNAATDLTVAVDLTVAIDLAGGSDGAIGGDDGGADLRPGPDLVPTGVSVDPRLYDPARLGVARAAWVAGMGTSEGGDGNSYGLLLQKNAPTAAVASAFGEVLGLGPIDGAALALGFDSYHQGHCGSGAPRFEVTTSDGQVHFLACAYGDISDAPTAGWDRVRFDGARAAPPLVAGTTVTAISLLLDEGADTPVSNRVLTPGMALLDNIVLGSHVVRVPGPNP